MSDPQGKIGRQSSTSEAVQVQILENGYAAALFIPQGVQEFPSQKQIYIAIERAGISHGINDAVIDVIIQQGITGKAVVFAKGRQAVRGSSARLIWHENSRSEPISLDITGRLDETNQTLDVFQLVARDQHILTKVPAQDGEVGINVLGEAVSYYGIDVSLPSGVNTYASKDGLSLLAGQDGVATIVNGKISVMDIHHVKGSVGPSTGSIQYDGSVFIDGDILSGFKVEALGDIYISGNILGADVSSRSGNVIIKKGINGEGCAQVLAGGRVSAEFIQDATIGAKSDVKVDRYITNSAVTAGRYIFATTNEGLVSGGTLFANKKIEIGVAGSTAHPLTELKVGYTLPEHISLSRYQRGESERQNRLMLADVEKRITFLTLMKERMGSLTVDKEKQLASWQTQEKFLQGKYLEQDAKSAEIEMHGHDTQHNRKEAETIRIHQTVYPGVTIGIGASSFSVDTERRNVIFFRIGDRITIGP